MQINLSRWAGRILLGALPWALGLLPAVPLHADTGKATAMLAALLEQAWLRHPQAAGLAARAQEARAAQDIAAGLTPEPAAVTLGNLNDRQGRNVGRQEWEVEVAMPLWLPGQRAARGVEAASRVDENAARRAALRLELAGELREAWWSLATARAVKALAVRKLDTARLLAGNVQKRFKVGELSRIDANLAQGEVLAAEAEALESEAAVQQAEQLFRLLTGLTAPAAVNDEMQEKLAAGHLSGNAAGHAQDHAALADLHPQLAAAAALARTARARLKVAEESQRAAPELALRVVRDRNDFADNYANNVGVRLRIPLSSGAQVRRDSSAAQAEAEQADAEMRRAEMRVQQEVDRARRALEGSERLLAMAAARRTLAADNLQLAEKSFALGEADLATLLRIRSAAFEAESSHDRQRLARAAAISRFNQAQGVLP